MSWFGDGLTSLKGQLSNFAKALAEDSEDLNENENQAGSTEPKQETEDGEPERVGRKRQASEGWTDVQLTTATSEELVLNPEPIDESDNALKGSSALLKEDSVSPKKTNSEKDVSSIIRGGIVNFFQISKDATPSSSKEHLNVKKNQEVQTESYDPSTSEVHHLREIINRLTYQNESLLRDVERLGRVAADLEAQVAVSQDENANLSTGLEELDIQHQRAIESVMTVKDNTLKDYEIMKVKFKELEEELAILKNNEKESDAACKKERELIRELEERDQELECVEGENASLRESIKELTKQLEKSKESLPAICEHDAEEVESLQHQIELLQCENTKKSQSLDESKRRIDTMNSQLEERELQLSKQIKILQDSHDSLESNVLSLESRLVQSNLQVDNLKRDCETKDRRMCQILLESNASEQETKAQLEQVKKKCEHLMSELEESKNNQMDLHNSRTISSDQESNEKILQLIQENEKLNAQSNCLNSEKDKLSKEILELTSTLSALACEKDKLKSDFEKISNDHEESKAKYDIQESQLLEKLTEYSNSNENLKSLIKDLETELDHLKVLSQQYQIDKEIFQQKELEMKNQLQLKDEEITTLKMSESKIENEWRSKTEELAKQLEISMKEKEICQSKIIFVEEEVKRINETLFDKNEELKEYEDIKIKLNKSMEFIDSLTKERDNLKSHETAMQFELEQLSIKNVKEKQENNNKHILMEIESELEKKNNILAERDSEIEELKRKLMILGDEVSNYTEMKSSVEQSEKERINFLKKIDSITEQNIQLLSDIVRINSENADMKAVMTSSHIQEVSSWKEKYEAVEIEFSTLKSQSTIEISELKKMVTKVEDERTELLRSIQIKHNECIGYQTEVLRLNEVLKAEKSKFENIIVEKSQLEMKCGKLLDLEKKVKKSEESETAHLKEISILQTEVQNLKDQLGYASELLKETKRQEAEGQCEDSDKTCPNGCAQTQEELTKLSWSLHTEQANNKTLQKQLADYKDKLEKSELQLSRLQSHLVDLERSQTEELVEARDQMKELQLKLEQAEGRVRHSSTAYTSASIRANQQVESLTQQVRSLTEQKEKIEAELSRAEDSALKQQAAVTNLQAVLHQFQIDKEKDIEFETERIRQKLKESQIKYDELANEMKQSLEQLNEAKKGLIAASRLTEQLNKKSEIIETLQSEITVLKDKLIKEEEKVNVIHSSVEGKIDRSLVKNLLVGFVCAPEKSKTQVLRVLSSVLDLNMDERKKVGLEASSAQQQQSLSLAFIKFLENESQPKPQLVLSLPETPEIPSRRTSLSSNSSLLLNDPLPSLPLRSSSFLKDVLKDPN